MKELEAVERSLKDATLETSGDSVDPRELPLAPWEGARQRSWGLVLMVAVVVALMGLGGFVLLGIPPVQGFVAAITGSLPDRGLLKAVESAPHFLANAPLRVHLMIFAAFVLVNVLFVTLLRRRTRGYDV